MINNLKIIFHTQSTDFVVLIFISSFHCQWNKIDKALKSQMKNLMSIFLIKLMELTQIQKDYHIKFTQI